MRQPRPSLQLLDLPNEIIGHVFAFLDSMPPSLTDVMALPARPQVQHVASTPLKKASILNHRLRKICLPLLFRHIFISSVDRLSSIFAFAVSNDLALHVATAQIYLHGPSSHQRPAWWIRLLEQFPRLSTLTITAPPNVFAEVVSQPIKLSDAWAFKIPFQTIQLHYDPSTTSSTALDHTSILHARPWSSFLVNESCSLLAYTTYEYFLRSTPSPLWPDPAHNVLHLLCNIRSFSFVAIFPTYTHVAQITEIMKNCMPRIEAITIKLLPDPQSTVLQDMLEASGHHFDVNDPWNEFETSLTLIGSAVVDLSGTDGPDRSLRELSMPDVCITGLKDTIEEGITRWLTEQPVHGWAYRGQGLWRRDLASETAETITQ
ncbi:uncharacterized protein HMPREF1541_02555 [Cyphellophora europaea CBS 101466]|uniref:F-box domain-containing protein n=1 Tax=Cyphellophora europaea (strain CBS 101466) TaxID=1220924 RepID=W2S3Y1_CYPE1|nr:uncharacterized protein HMPREF1541_02555 [Cyphellophora europaea CBS 101466]ETN43396.1 hypothetical protein HMPREF1541_02555 [Cyphellophora europaea CBS 101466]